MDCDQVFFVLTRGPFPSGAAEDVAVEHHLERCTSCWQIAEALRPAGDLFQEAISPVESRDLPGYWGDTSPPGALLAQVSRSRTPEVASRSGRSNRYDAEAARRGAARLIAPGKHAKDAPWGPRRGVSPWRDVAQVATFLVLVTSAVCGLSWLCSF